MSKPHGPVVPQLPPKQRVTCPHGHVMRTRNPPGTQMPCSPCGQEGRAVTVTVPAPLPAIRPETFQGKPTDIAVLAQRKTGPERWYCAGCRGSIVCPAPGQPPLGWLQVQAGMLAGDSADLQILVRACSAEHLALVLPEIRDKLAGEPFMPPDTPGPHTGTTAALMRETPRRR